MYCCMAKCAYAVLELFYHLLNHLIIYNHPNDQSYPISIIRWCDASQNNKRIEVTGKMAHMVSFAPKNMFDERNMKREWNQKLNGEWEFQYWSSCGSSTS